MFPPAASGLFAALVLSVGCAPEPEVLQVRQGIYGGVPAPFDHAVFEINSAVGGCTATLIAPRTLLTANHCVAVGSGVTATNQPSSAELFTSVEIRTWYDYRADAGSGDLALIWLDRAPPVVPLAWSVSRRLQQGDPIRHVGYGFDENGGIGVRRTVTTTVTGFTNDKRFGEGVQTGGTGVGICNGDSGGPALGFRDGGVERVVAVHSYGAGSACGPGVSVWLPSYRTFIEDWLRTHEDAGCPRDDRCVQGCDPVDPDCTCAADGQCTAACEDLLDPDCPANCRADGVCSPSACPRLDDDCLPPGGACVRPAQCQTRLCISDPQNVNTYCADLCARGCTAGFECAADGGVCIKAQRPSAALGSACEAATFCLEDGECVAGVCAAVCASNASCRANELCRPEAPRICVKATVTLPRAANELPAAPERGCSVAGGSLVALLGLLSRTARNRRAAGARTPRPTDRLRSR